MKATKRVLCAQCCGYTDSPLMQEARRHFDGPRAWATFEGNCEECGWVELDRNGACVDARCPLHGMDVDGGDHGE